MRSREGKRYILKKYHSPFITSREAGSEMIVLIQTSTTILGRWIDEDAYATSISCMVYEFNRIFKKK